MELPDPLIGAVTCQNHMEDPENGEYPTMDEWKILSKWMIWAYPHFRKPSYYLFFCLESKVALFDLLPQESMDHGTFMGRNTSKKPKAFMRWEPAIVSSYFLNLRELPLKLMD